MLGVETASTMRAPDPLMNSDLFDADDDESDEEVFRSMKSKQKRPTKSQRLILSDDEDEERSPSLLDQGKSQSDGEESDADHGKPNNQDEDRQEMMDGDDDSSNNDSDNDKPKQRKNIQKSLESSDDSDDDLSNDHNKPKERKKIRKPVESSDDSDDDLSNGDDDDKPKERKKIRKPVESSDDSDDDSSNDDSDNDKPEEKKKSRRPVRSSDDSDGDDSSDEEEIAFQLTPPPQDPETNGDKRSMRRKRINKDELQQIHSETQRIVRESTIRIPYHRPTPLSLDELFNKKPSLTALRPIRARVPRIHGKELLNTSTEQEKGQESRKEETDELPDLLSSQVQNGPGNNVSCEENPECSSENVLAEDKPSETETDNVAMVTEEVAANDTLLQDAPKESSRNSPVADGKSAQSPTSSSESNQKELSPQRPSQDSPKESLPRISQQPLQEQQAPIFKTPPPTTSTQPDPQSSQARRMKRLQDSLIRLKGVQPKLSGGPKITIDLEEGGEPSAEEKGVVKLKNRFVQHTKHIKITHQKDVQVNIVTKEKGEDGKEDLKHHTFTVGLDKQPEQIDPSLNVPGAKLCHLKQNLQATMRVKREQERLKRREAYKLDNEEGFGGEEDEDEAELTDGSETEGEEEEEQGIGHEDEDADYEPGNEFLDDEAESDDDDDDNEMGDEMDDEEEEESTLIKKVKKKSRSLEKESTLIDSDEEISPSRRKGSKRRAMVVDDVEDGGDEEKGISLRLDSTGTEDTDTEISDVLQDSSRFNSVRTPRTPSALDQCSKTMEMYDSATNSTVSDFQVPISRVDSSSKKVAWSASKDTDSSKDSMSFVLPAPVRQDSSSNSLDTSFEAMTSLIPAHQPQGGMTKSGRASVDSTKGETFTPFSRHQSALSSSTSKIVSRNELTLPVEDSQDLFREDYPRLPTIADSQQVTESQSFHFSFEDETQTQFLDENGLLNLKPSISSKKKTMFEDTQTHSAESQSSMDELLGLCSGQFAATQGQDDVTAQKPGPFSQVSQRAGTQANMDELLNLCSGTFTEMESKSQITSTRKVEEKDEKEDDDHLSFHIASDHDGPDSDDDGDKGFSSDEEDVAPKKRRRIIQQESDDDEEEEEEEGAEKGEEESDLDSEFEFNRDLKGFKGKTYSKKLNLANFVEDEAELSGSEADSDENYDAEDDDEEIEGIINEEVGDEDELRDQVNKVHLKTVDDDDARRLRILKEMYLPDGDLHSDNKGRTRKFRWRHMDSQIDMFRPGSDGEEDEEDGQDQDSQWRLMRYQREQWLKENEEKTDAVTPDPITSSLDEKSQFAKCLKAATFKKPQVDTSTQDVEEKEQKKDTTIATTKPLNIMNKRGSFLSRSKNDLAKMASMLKPVTNPQGPRSTRNFVFQSAESSFGEESIVEPPKVKRSASVSGPSTTPSGPLPKRPRLERSQSQFTSNSVFRHF